jgi:hypothetical protein
MAEDDHHETSVKCGEKLSARPDEAGRVGNVNARRAGTQSLSGSTEACCMTPGQIGQDKAPSCNRSVHVVHERYSRHLAATYQQSAPCRSCASMQPLSLSS